MLKNVKLLILHSCIEVLGSVNYYVRRIIIQNPFHESNFYPPHFVRNLTSLICAAGILLVSNDFSAQTFWTASGGQATTSTAGNIITTSGNIGVRLSNPQANLHLHGTQNYVTPDGIGMDGIVIPGINYGLTSRMLFSTTTTTSGAQRGFEIRYSVRDMVMRNQETNGNFTLSANGTPTLQFHSSSGRVFLGNGPAQGSQTWGNRASINIDHSSANGLYIRAANANRYGLFIHSQPNQAAFVIESGTGFTTTRNFSITGDGYVFARRYTTTLGPIGDYVFAPNYYLMPLSELRVYIRENSHLPNVMPTSVAETTETDLVEFAKTLLVKIEENTLYILQLEERIKQLEAER